MDDQKKAEEKKKEEKERSEQMRRIAVYTGIPGAMLGGLIVGYFLGIFIHRFIPSDKNNITLAICLMLGFFGGMYQVYEMIKKFK